MKKIQLIVCCENTLNTFFYLKHFERYSSCFNSLSNNKLHRQGMATVTYQNAQGGTGFATYNSQQPPSYTQPGYAPYQQGHPVPVHGQSNVVVVSQPGVQGVRGTCPYCGLGFARSDYSTIGILIAILFFPLGIICCLMMTERRCTHCRAKI